MRCYFKLLTWSITMMMMFTQCREKYIPKVDPSNTRLLVIEGFINSGQGPTTIHLSRTTDLQDTAYTPEPGAQLNVEGNDGNSFALYENTNGEYSIPQLTMNNNVKYRLHIRTVDGKEYASDYSSVQYTPSIDSITWQIENGGVRIYVNTHNDQNDTGYYRWTYSETWEFHSRFFKMCSYIIDPSTGMAIGVICGPDPDTTIYKCWTTQNSTNIILGSSERLTADRIYLPIRYVEPQSEELTVLYYIHLKQYALSKDAYRFYQGLKKNTEQIGSLFDPQPSKVVGNVHCINDPGQTAIGYVEISQAQEKDIFIHNSDLPVIWTSQIPCSEFLLKNKPPLNTTFIPTRVGELGPYNSIVSYYATDPICVDCTLRGTNIKPSFWP